MDPVKTHIATSDETSITVRGLDLVNDLMGKHSFTAACRRRARPRCSMPVW